MSVIAQKKAQQKQGSEIILVYMGLVCISAALINFLFILIFNWSLSLTVMAPLMYFLMLAGLCFGITSYIREHDFDLSRYNEWLYSFIFLGILNGAILSAYMF